MSRRLCCRVRWRRGSRALTSSTRARTSRLTARKVPIHPVALGVRRAMWLSAALHVVTIGCLAALPIVTSLGGWYVLGCVLIAAVLVYEHWIVRPDDLSRINKAFFDLNGYVSIVFLLFLGVDVLWG